jgi:hypothetical protein
MGVFHRLLLWLRCLCPSLYKHSVPTEGTYIPQIHLLYMPLYFKAHFVKTPFFKSFRYIYNNIIICKDEYFAHVTELSVFNILDKCLIIV